MGNLTYRSLNNAHQNYLSPLLTVGWQFTEGSNTWTYASPLLLRHDKHLYHVQPGILWTTALKAAMTVMWHWNLFDFSSLSKGSVGFELISEYVVFILVRISLFSVPISVGTYVFAWKLF